MTKLYELTNDGRHNANTDFMGKLTANEIVELIEDNMGNIYEIGDKQYTADELTIEQRIQVMLNDGLICEG